MSSLDDKLAGGYFKDTAGHARCIGGTTRPRNERDVCKAILELVIGIDSRTAMRGIRQAHYVIQQTHLAWMDKQLARCIDPIPATPYTQEDYKSTSE